MDAIERQKVEQSPIFRERLKEEGRDLLFSSVRYVLILACFLYTSFYGLDIVASPEHHLIFLGLRLFVLLNYLAGLVLLSSKHGSAIAGPLSVWETYVSTLAIAVMTTFIGGFDSSYYIGIIFVFFVAGLFLPWNIAATLTCGLLTLVSYFVVNIFFGPTESVKITKAIFPFFFLSGAIIFTVFANATRERIRRRDLRLRMQIEKANEDLKELDNAKMRFFSNVSHELRSPLTLILGPLESILSGSAPPDPRPLLEAMEANARRLLRQVNTLLDFAKLDAGRLKCNYEYANIGTLLEELVMAAKPQAEKRQIDLRVEGTKDFPGSIFDPDKVETIAANLLSNAVKFTPDGGRITIKVFCDDQSVWFDVEDTGAGIPEDQLEAVFERFRQVDDGLSRRASGTGLGLAMVQELSKLHGGTVTVKSKIGAGTTFTVTLPRTPELNPVDRRRISGRRRADQLAQERTVSMLGLQYEKKSSIKTLLSDVSGAQLKEGATIDSEIQTNLPSDTPRILVVDDNPDLRTFIAHNLASLYRVEMAEDGLDGLEKARRRPPDLIVSDIMMPRMNGYELCKQIRQDNVLKSVPVILATSKSGGEAVVEGLEVGANDYLAKPFEIRELMARVKAHIRSRKLEKDLQERDSRLTAIGQMTSAIVHDLKNPISSILGFAEIARQDILTGKEIEMITQDLEPVVSEANRLNRMIAEVLDFARGSSSDLNLIPTEFTAYLDMLCTPLQPKLSSMGIELIVRHESGPNLLVQIDNDRMLRVFENLIRNAQEAIWAGGQAPQGKHIWITTRCDERSVTARVADDGPGISTELAPHLFDAFITGEKRSGTGLGLATVRNLIIAHGGEITVEPQSAEGGAAFCLTFPLIKNG